MILDEIVQRKKIRVQEKFGDISVEVLQKKAMEENKPILDFEKALKNCKNITIIAEIKFASPSKGRIKTYVDPVEIAKQYEMAGASAISVLTEEDYFCGSDEDLIKVRKYSSLPILRKDFIVNVKQIYQSRLIGADAILLISSILSDKDLSEFQSIAKTLGLHCLVEVHDENDVKKALDSGARIIGINNRDLNTFKVDLKTTEKLVRLIPRDKVIVSESGISTRKDAEYLMGLGVDAILVGEALMKAESIKDKLEELKVRRI